MWQGDPISERRLPRTALAALAVAVAATLGLATYALLAPTPSSANPLSGFTEVEAGGYSTCGITTSNGLRCWGSNDFGTLTDGRVCAKYCLNPVDSTYFTSGIVDVALGENHTCALTASETVQCIGLNLSNELGDGGACGAECYAPVTASGISGDVSAVEAGGSRTCVVITDGTVECWGDGLPVLAVAGISTATDIAVAFRHACALTSVGGVKCWGHNASGQLGDGTTTDSSTAVDVAGLASGVTAITVGADFSCARTSAGSAKCWGVNDRHQLGSVTGTFCNPPFNTVPCATTPVSVTDLSSGVTQIDAGKAYACALVAGGAVKCWGHNDNGQLGDGTLTERSAPVGVIGLSGATDIAAADATFTSHTCARLSDGRAKCWGVNSYGQLGDGQTCGFTCTTPSTVSSAKPTPTPTPCGVGGCPTPGPDLDFSIGIDTDSDGDIDCTTFASISASCSLPPASPFRVQLSLHGFPTGTSDYAGYDGFLVYSGPEPSLVVDFSLWPDCALPATGYAPGIIVFGCSDAIGASGSSYVGPMAAVEFGCTGPRTVELRHEIGQTDLVRVESLGPVNYYEQPGLPETLSITCDAPPATPTPQPVGGIGADTPTRTSVSDDWTATLLLALLGVAGVAATVGDVALRAKALRI